MQALLVTTAGGLAMLVGIVITALAIFGLAGSAGLYQINLYLPAGTGDDPGPDDTWTRAALLMSQLDPVTLLAPGSAQLPMTEVLVTMPSRWAPTTGCGASRPLRPRRRWPPPIA